MERTESAPRARPLEEIDAQQRHPLGDGEIKLPAWNPSRAVRVDFSNVDYRVTLRIDDRIVLRSTDEQYDSDVVALATERRNAPPAGVQISAARMQARLAHVVLQRDVFYRSTRHEEMGNSNSSNAWQGQSGWGTSENPHLLRDKEYFMLGDNSPQSKDSRMWWIVGPHLLPRGEDYQVGTVPEDQLIGKAFFVYWPSGIRLTSKLPIGVIPNVGEMRWIR
jgi:hypothetical protein